MRAALEAGAARAQRGHAPPQCGSNGGARAVTLFPPRPPPAKRTHGAGPPMPSKRMQELEEVSKELLKVLVSDWAGSLLQRSLDKRTRADDKLLGAQATAARLLRELTAAEETVARTLLERESELQRLLRRLRDLEQELERAREVGAELQSSHDALRRELEELREQSRRLEEETERDEDAVPSAAYVTQLYYKISRIDWDYGTEAAQIKGIHYGPDIAQPIDIDGSRHSRCFVSDYLWSLVPTTW
ncbi:kinetochore protein Spc24 isoform X1 [Columba livia]|uniref:kinetochore protein Spc24 isoform X1 n=2 Tax=Columba livia TaxID=8932 RepID=UPI0031BA3B11